MKKDFNQEVKEIREGVNKSIFQFEIKKLNANIDTTVVKSFGDEWEKFFHFSEEEISQIGKQYFDIIDERMVNKSTYGIDIGCGTGRWTKYLSSKIGFMEALDPSEAIYSAEKLLGTSPNVRFSQASIDNIPFMDETFDFAMSIGVLHHVPDTTKAMRDCVKKVKIGGWFYTYLYYNLENRSIIHKILLTIVTGFRFIISRLPSFLKKMICDLIAITIYLPIIIFGRLLKFSGFRSLAIKLPLSFYQDKTFFIIRNDALDRFGTKLEQRFSKAEIQEIMKAAGLSNVVFSDKEPLYHAVGKRIF